MNVSKKPLPKSQIEYTFELSVEDLKPYLEAAAKEISESKPFEGFRPGKAPFEMVKQRVGEMALLQQATNAIIGQTFYAEIDKEATQIVEQPSIEVLKMAPGNPFIYKAIVSMLPGVKLSDYKKAVVKPLEEVKVTEKEVNKVIDDLREMRVKDVVTERAAEMKDKVEVTFETFVDGVAIPGGKAEKYPLVLGSNSMIPGFEKELVGLKKDQEKEFTLSFPKEYHSEKLANKQAKFKVKVTEVFERVMPEVTDEFAKQLGVKDVADLKTHLEKNLQEEKQNDARQKQDVEIIKALIEKSNFEDLPDVLINQETEKMMHELQDNVERQGLKMVDYLNHLKKKEADMKLDFVPDAIKRVKTAIAIRQIAVDENITASEEEIHAEADRTLASYQMNPQYAEQLKTIQQNIESPASHRYFANLITNRKVMEMLRKNMVKE